MTGKLDEMIALYRAGYKPKSDYELRGEVRLSLNTYRIAVLGV